MGVHGLWRLIEPSGKTVPVETLENKVLAVGILFLRPQPLTNSTSLTHPLRCLDLVAPSREGLPRFKRATPAERPSPGHLPPRLQTAVLSRETDLRFRRRRARPEETDNRQTQPAKGEEFQRHRPSSQAVTEHLAETFRRE